MMPTDEQLGDPLIDAEPRLELLRSEGWARLDHVLDDDQRAQLLDACTQSTPDDSLAPGSHMARDLFRADPGIQQTLALVGLTHLAAEALGVGTAEIINDRVFRISPNSSFQTPWHQDSPLTPVLAGRPMLVVWILLQGDLDSAPLQFIPRSHRTRQVYLDSRLSDLADRSESPVHWIEPNDPELHSAVTAAARPGDVLVFDGWTVHASLPNDSSELRVAYSVRYSTPE